MIRGFLHHIKEHKKASIAYSLLAVVLAFIVFQPFTAQGAGIVGLGIDGVNWLTTTVVSGFVWVLGRLLIVLINLVVWVAQYNGFITSPAVSTGWTILRDICNMFFILVLLVIAFTTTLNFENYSMKRLLPRFIIAAVLINFSKLICGVAIDFVQIIMLTFVNGFRDIGAGNLADMLGITKLLTIDPNNATAASTLSVLGTYILALLYVVIAGGVIAVILVLLIMRIVMIWIYVVLSPLPYLMMVLPKTQPYAGQWVSQFVSALVSGPILAFFIWLSFASATIGSRGQDIIGINQNSSSENESKYIQQFNDTSVGLAESGSSDGILKFIISIGLLIGGVMITKQAGGTVGQIAGRFSDRLQKGGINFAKARGAVMAKATGRTALGTAGLVGKGAGIGLSKLGESRLGKSAFGKYTGIGAISRGVGTSLKSGGQFMTDWRKDLKETRVKEKVDKRKKMLEKFGMKETSLKSLEEAAKTPLARGIKGAAMSGLGVASMNPVFMAAGAGMLGKAVLANKWLGGKVKKWAAKRQKNQDIKQAENLMTDTDKEKVNEKEEARTKMREERNQKFADIDAQKNTEINAQKTRNEQEYNNAVGAGVSQPELDAMTKTHEKSLDDIAKKYSDLRDDAEKKYYKDAEQMDKTIEDKYKDRTSSAAEAYDIAQRTVKRDHEIKEADSLKDAEMKRIKEQRAKEVADAKTKFAASPLARDRELKKINEKYDGEEQTANNSHKDLLKMIGSDYKDIPQTTELRGISKKASGLGERMNKYEPNKLTIDAAQAGTKEWREAESLVKALGAGGGLRQTDAGSYSGLTGLSGKQEKFFETLSKGDEAAKNAVDAMIKDLKAIQAEGINLPKGKKDMIEALKRGIAMFKKKKPETSGAFSTLASELDNTNMGEGKRVDDYTPKD